MTFIEFPAFSHGLRVPQFFSEAADDADCKSDQYCGIDLK
jgi:hypothetical protein